MQRTLYRDAALADGTSDELQVGISVLVENGRITWIRPADAESDPGDANLVDAAGTTIVPGLVDAHSHLTGPGGANWIERFFDDTDVLVENAERNAILQNVSGIRWARDVGSPRRLDPIDRVQRALSIGIRDRWRDRPDRPYVRAAGSWIAPIDYVAPGLAFDVKDGDELLAAAEQQLADGADFVKVILDGPDPETAAFTVDEVRNVVEAAHAQSAKVTVHCTNLRGAQVAAAAPVDSIEHGTQIDADTAATMAENGVGLVSTLTVYRSWMSFSRTTSKPRFAESENARKIGEHYESALQSVRYAKEALVRIAAGTDFGGGSARANQMAWEVESLVEAGLEPWEALAAATWRGGELLGEPDAGRIKEGGPADFFLVHGDPLSDPSALWRVWRVAWLE